MTFQWVGGVGEVGYYAICDKGVAYVVMVEGWVSFIIYIAVAFDEDWGADGGFIYLVAVESPRGDFKHMDALAAGAEEGVVFGIGVISIYGVYFHEYK